MAVTNFSPVFLCLKKCSSPHILHDPEVLRNQLLDSRLGIEESSRDQSYTEDIAAFGAQLCASLGLIALIYARSLKVTKS